MLPVGASQASTGNPAGLGGNPPIVVSAEGGGRQQSCLPVRLRVSGPSHPEASLRSLPKPPTNAEMHRDGASTGTQFCCSPLSRYWVSPASFFQEESLRGRAHPGTNIGSVQSGTCARPSSLCLQGLSPPVEHDTILGLAHLRFGAWPL